MAKENPSDNSPRNSPLRAIGQKILDPLIEQIKKIPNIKADHLTLAGVGLVGLGSLIKTLNPESNAATKTAFILMTLGIFTDALDGALARALNQSSENGALLDLLSDRTQESIMALSRITTASLRKDGFGVLAATLAGLTNPLPSFFRAKAEKKGIIVPESGKNPLTFLGTRPARAVSGVINTNWPTLINQPFSSQAGFDSLTTLTNIANSIERYYLTKKQPGNPDSKLQSLASKKEEYLKKFVLINSLVILSAGIIGLASCNK